MLILQEEFNYSEKILNGEMAHIIYRDAVQKIKGDLTFLLLGSKTVTFRSPGFLKDKLGSYKMMDYNALTVCAVFNRPDSCRAILCFCERTE